MKEMPIVEWQAEPNSFYTLMLIGIGFKSVNFRLTRWTTKHILNFFFCPDPDAPSRKNPIARSWQHWIVTNVPGSNVVDGQTISQYIGAGPPKDSGLHRYTFLLYKQSGKQDFNELTLGKSTRNRANFSATNFSDKHNLGNPIAGNVFQAQYDDYVPILYSELNR